MTSYKVCNTKFVATEFHSAGDGMIAVVSFGVLYGRKPDGWRLSLRSITRYCTCMSSHTHTFFSVLLDDWHGLLRGRFAVRSTFS